MYTIPRDKSEVNPTLKKSGTDSPSDGDNSTTAQSGPLSIDWSVEPEQNTPPLPEKAELAAALAETAITNTDRVTPNEAQAATLGEAGVARESDIAELAAFTEERAGIDRIESEAMQMAEHVMEVV